MLKFFSVLPLIALLAGLAGCGSSQQGRDWRLYDTRTEYRSTELCFLSDFQTGPNGREIIHELGCLKIVAKAEVRDNIDVWRVYEAEDWKVSEVGVRTTRRFLISDPPGQIYSGVTDQAHPESVPTGVRQPVGLQTENLNLATYPIKLSWQISMGDGRAWIEDPKDLRIALSGDKVLNQGSQGIYLIQLCDSELRTLQAMPADEFAVMIRLESLDWPTGIRKPLRKDFYLRERITREAIRRQLAVKVGSDETSSPSPPGGTGGG
jgi:hypothetical protein